MGGFYPYTNHYENTLYTDKKNVVITIPTIPKNTIITFFLL